LGGLKERHSYERRSYPPPPPRPAHPTPDSLPDESDSKSNLVSRVCQLSSEGGNQPALYAKVMASFESDTSLLHFERCGMKLDLSFYRLHAIYILSRKGDSVNGVAGWGGDREGARERKEMEMPARVVGGGHLTNSGRAALQSLTMGKQPPVASAHSCTFAHANDTFTSKCTHALANT
jgi:hypothetical protein